MHLNLTLRQRKLLHIMQHQHTLITGQELADRLHVSGRTIRSDVIAINNAILPYQAQILSERSKGYTFFAQDPGKIQALNQIENAFLTREDRIRYLAIRLCLSDAPLNLYDLEDEIFVSHTTLEHDILQLKRQYMYAKPFLQITTSKNYVSVEANEEKIRYVLIELFHQDWNYENYGNAYYGYHFIEPEHLEFIMHELPIHLIKYNLLLDDPTTVVVDLMILIMYHRVKTGHPLPEKENTAILHDDAYQAITELFVSLEAYFGISFSHTERYCIYDFLSSNLLQSPNSQDFEGTRRQFDPLIHQIAEEYLLLLDEVFRIDFHGDEDFYTTLLFFIRDLMTRNRFFALPKNLDTLHELLIDELEAAFLFQRISNKYLDHRIEASEIYYLAYVLSGAFLFMHETNPKGKLRTVICCHLNPSAYWSLKRQILSGYDKYLDVVELLPINAKTFYDFSHTDLILTTAKTDLTNNPRCEVIRIHSFLTPEDNAAISSYVSRKHIETLCPHRNFSLHELLTNAAWHERQTLDAPFDILYTLAQDFLGDGTVTEKDLQLLLQKEATISAATRPGLLFLVFPCKAEKTKFSVMTLEHRIKWKGYKIRTIILASFRTEDSTLIFPLNRIFHDEICSNEKIKMLKTRAEICAHFENF